jgi:ribose transport system substrate-binding protein
MGVGVSAALAVGVAACGSDSGGSGGGGGSAGGDSASAGGPSQSVKFDWGEFKLDGGIASKISNKQKLNFVLSYQILNQPGAPAQLKAGLEAGAKEASAKYGVDIGTDLIGPAEVDPPTQISQVRQAIGAHKIDCGGVEPVTPDAFESIINEATSKGVPMMTVNTDSPKSHRIAYFGANDDQQFDSPLQMGKIAGDVTVNWAKKNNVDLNGQEVALVTGDTTAAWAQARMKGWVETVKKAFPSVKVIGTPTNALTVGYDPAQVLAKVSSFMTGHPNVRFYYHTDWGANQIGQLIKRRNLQGKVDTIGYNLDKTYVQDLQQKLIIATIDQRYDLQAKNFVLGCADFLLGKKVPDHFQFVKPSTWTPDNVDEALKVYSQIPNSGV